MWPNSALCGRCGYTITGDCHCDTSSHGCPYCGTHGLHWCGFECLRDGEGKKAWTCNTTADSLPEEPSTAPDMVNHPPHYTQGSVECIDAIRAALGDEGLVAYCRGNALKYLWRTGQKGDAVQDLEKAIWYITKAVEVQRGTP